MRNTFLCDIVLILTFAVGLATVPATARPQPHSRAEAKARKYPSLPDNVERRQVTIWSDGTRMAADIYLPKGIKPEDKLPAVVFANGTGGVKRRLPTRIAPFFAGNGYAFIAFDYRGWGESDSKLMIIDEMPEPDEDEVVTVKVRAIRWQMDYADQTTDIRSVISFISGEKNIDPNRIGIFGTSFGGGLVTWVAAHDRRVKCLVAQVPGMGGGRIAKTEDSAYALARKQARGETEPVPYKTNRPGGKMSRYGHVRYNKAKWIGYDPVASAHQITAPTLLIDAGKDELMDLRKNAGAVANILKAKGTIVNYHVFPDISHYGVYRQKFKEVTEMELAWFDKYLKAK